MARPTLALALGDAAGIGSELAAKVLADRATRSAARFIVIGDRRQLQMGAAHAGLEIDLPDMDEAAADGDCFVDLGNLDPDSIEIGESSQNTGRAALDNFSTALRIGNEGGADAVCFTPFNKHAMRLAKPDFVDEIGFIRATIEADKDGSEFNVLDELWNARVTSHIPLSEVAGRITEDRVFDSIMLTDSTMRGAGHESPRIAVAALNPHAGDGGNFGREESEIIEPAVRRAADLQVRVTGPLPSDTVYMRANKGEFDVVLSMYHDQGQIAMKLIGFDRGVTLIGGYPFWISTPAHGTAYDIAGRGEANPQATINAFNLAARLAAGSDEELAPVDARDPAIRKALEKRTRTN